MKNIFAYTPTEYPPPYPPYISINQRYDGKYYVSVRSICGWSSAEIEIPFEELLKMGAACTGVLGIGEDD